MSYNPTVDKNGSPLPKKGAPAATVNQSDLPYESPYMRQPKKFNFWRGIYNKDKNYILGRTPRNWGSLLVFYTIFYIILAALFAICMQGLFATLSDTEPRWQLDESRIGSNPGLGFRPLPNNMAEGSLIMYTANDSAQVALKVKLLQHFLTPYIDDSKNTAGGNPNQVHCDFETATPAGKVCAVDASNFGPCTLANGFGYSQSKPCIFIKLNRIFNWVPEYYDDILSLPDEMPAELREYIVRLPAAQRKQVWVSCKGEREADQEHIGPVQYSPSRGFPGYFYPYRNVAGYLSPLIAVQFERPTQKRIINIECRAWAKNIQYVGSERDRQGSVHLELLVD